ncbi:MAG TPA: HdeD family acid-resistance protein [Usitatibacter sp.]|jgi:uncharacterized membrane protein HdeD (DUF308 family)|nr:HdeD family acid-resistance protein [Usitatibacter sp.]
MDELLHRAWWMVALRGVAALIFGVLAILLPGVTLLVLVALFAAYALITGIAEIVAAMRARREHRGWGLLLSLGIVAVAAGILAVVYPGITAFMLVILMGVNAIFTGALDIAIAIRLRRVIRNEWMLILAGVVSLVFGVLVLAYPAGGALALVWLVSFYAIVTGVLFIALSVRLRAMSTPRTGRGDRLVGAD